MNTKTNDSPSDETMITVELSPVTVKVLEDIAAMSKCSVSQVVSVLLAQYVIRMEALAEPRTNEVST